MNLISKIASFDRELSDAIEETLNDLFGENICRIIFYNIGKTIAAKDSEIFFKNIETMLDFDNGSELVRRHVLERLYAKNDVPFEEKEGYTFNDYLKIIKEKEKEKKKRKG